jgi:hypothetical protein
MEEFRGITVLTVDGLEYVELMVDTGESGGERPD